MRLRYDEDFVEAAVLYCTTGRRQGIGSLQIARFNHQREKLYSILDPEERNAAFFRLHLEWFREWGLEKLVLRPLEEFPLLSSSLKVLAFRKSGGKNDEGSELYVNEVSGRHGVMAINTERFEREAELTRFLRHELTHLQDMIDPRFGYQPELPAVGPFPSQHRLSRERYRLLWDITIDGRLSRTGGLSSALREQRWLEFTAIFEFWTEPRQQEVFNSLWTNPSPTHHNLQELVCALRHVQSTHTHQPGALCPLCGFPTFAWVHARSLPDNLVRAIRSEFPGWTPEQGVCSRCREMFRAQLSKTPIAV